VAEVTWSPQSLQDLESIKSFVAGDSPHYAGLLVQKLVAAVERLAAFPNSGRVVPEFGDPRIREIVWRNYRLVYRLAGSSVEIVTVFHGSFPLGDKNLEPPNPV
jgi:plasmid stabilization system protein ParE